MSFRVDVSPYSMVDRSTTNKDLQHPKTRSFNKFTRSELGNEAESRVSSGRAETDHAIAVGRCGVDTAGGTDELWMHVERPAPQHTGDSIFDGPVRDRASENQGGLLRALHVLVKTPLPRVAQHVEQTQGRTKRTQLF